MRSNQVREDNKLQQDDVQGQSAAPQSLPSEDKRKSKCVSYAERDKVVPKVKGGKKTRSRKKKVTGEQMVAYMRAQEELRNVPVPSINTSRRQLKLADIFVPLNPKICVPESGDQDEPNVQGCEADLDKPGLKKHGNRADFSNNLGEIMANQRGQKKLGNILDYGVKVGRLDQGVKPAEEINTREDPGYTLVSLSVVNTHADLQAN